MAENEQAANKSHTKKSKGSRAEMENKVMKQTEKKGKTMKSLRVSARLSKE